MKRILLAIAVVASMTLAGRADTHKISFSMGLMVATTEDGAKEMDSLLFQPNQQVFQDRVRNKEFIPLPKNSTIDITGVDLGGIIAVEYQGTRYFAPASEIVPYMIQMLQAD